MTDNVGTHGSCVRISQALAPNRKSPRAYFHDYSGGVYFVTVCTRDKQHYFGSINAGEMNFSAVGKYCHEQLVTLSSHYQYVEVPLFVVMPNHVHAIICVCDGRTRGAGMEAGRTHEPCVPTVRTALSVVVGGFKRAVTMFARRHNIEFGWQSRYHDHIIRGTYDGNPIAEYIENNVARWGDDCFAK